MKQKTITIGNRTFLVLDLPKEARNVYVTPSTKFDNFETRPSLSYTDWVCEHGNTLPVGNWQLLGFISKEVAVKVVPECHFAYTDYMMKEPESYNGGNVCLKSALESLNSLLQSNGIITVNPLGEEPELSHFYSGDGCFDQNEYYLALTEWQTAQSQLWENICLLEKV